MALTYGSHKKIEACADFPTGVEYKEKLQWWPGN
jgi:hypothetical protein